MNDFANSYEWTDKPGASYEAHSHKGKVRLEILKGSIEVELKGQKIILHEKDTLDIPSGAQHAAKVGPVGCTYKVWEEIKGES